MIEEIYETAGPADELNTAVPESRRPALVRLALDIEGLIEELEAGFASRTEILRWLRRLITRTLGEVDTGFYRQMSTQFRGLANDGRERTLLAALLREDARVRELDPDVIDRLRHELVVEFIEPAFHRAFRSLRKSATEYVDEDGDSSDHNPLKQRYIAMRPALDELDSLQEQALETLLAGFADRRHIRQWGTVLELATHGEISEGFIQRATRERSTHALLTASEPTPAQQRARVLFAAHYLLPSMNRGVRELRDRTKEEPHAEQEDRDRASLG